MLKQIVAVGALAAIGLGGLWLFDSTTNKPAPHLVNRLWAERLPETDRDLVRYLVVASIEGVEAGGSVLASSWRINTDIFLWQLKGSRLRLEFPQDDKRGDFKVRTWDCRKDAPKPFELCMDLEHGGETMRFYSLDEWYFDPPDSGVIRVADLPPFVLDVPEQRACDSCELVGPSELLH